ncbi:MAG: prolipoprotein diacylglyceryl transferase [Candidatus Competibacterales bacterium]
MPDTTTFFVHPQFDPVALDLGVLQIRWYGLMYLLGFVAGWLLGRYRAGRRGFEGWTPQQVDDMVFYAILGVIVGGRLGFVLFYDFQRFVADPPMAFRIWEGGMAFHGGLLGVIVAMAWFAYRQGKGFFQVTDFIAPLVPPGLFFGRIGNFINQELWGRPTDVPWGMVFPQADAFHGTVAVPRHPSQLYEAALEGLALFVILWWFAAKPRPTAAVSGLFLLGYGTFRFAVEFVRQYDPARGFVAFGWMTMGQLLCVPMILAGLLLILWAYGRPSSGSKERAIP